MKKVLAAVDNTLAAQTVLATAASLGRLFGAEVETIHVREGPAVDALVEAGRADDVTALVVGSRRLPHTVRPIGTTALEVITSVLKPVAVVPPEAPPTRDLSRVLVPLEGTISTALAPRSIITLARDASVDVVVLHVQDAESVPAFTDQPQHQAAAWRDEFLARYCPWGLDSVTLELRVGCRAEQILAVADEVGADLIALGWSQDLAGGRAPVVREVLERGRTPALLIPVYVVANGDGTRSGPDLRLSTDRRP